MKQTRTETTDEIVEGPGEPNAISTKQEQALQAVISYPTLKEAALAAGISETTLWRYMREEGFSRRLREARREAFDQAITQLQKSSGEAVSVLRDLMKREDASPATRISAARTVLDYAMRAADQDELKGRIDELEKFILRKHEDDALDRGREASGGEVEDEDEG